MDGPGIPLLQARLLLPSLKLRYTTRCPPEVGKSYQMQRLQRMQSSNMMTIPQTPKEMTAGIWKGMAGIPFLVWRGIRACGKRNL